MLLLIDISLFKSPYTTCYISEERFLLADEHCYKCIDGKNTSNSTDFNDQIKSTDLSESGTKRLKFRSNALFLQPFVKECINSNVYRCNLLSNLRKRSGLSNDTAVLLKLILEPPDKEIIDYGWNMRMLQLVWTKVELENAFSWLSTLGGAYSALGDYFDNCAEQAGKISITQYKLSKMLGDESLAARSRLYSALAYAQKGNLKLSRHIVRSVAEFARHTKDVRLNKMCQGVWAKLKYLRQLEKK